MSITPFPTQGQYPWYDQLKNWGADTQALAASAFHDPSFSRVVAGRNLIDPSEIQREKFIFGDGSVQDFAGHAVSGFIPVKAGTAITMRVARASALYDLNKVSIPGTNHGNQLNDPVTITPAQDGFLRVATPISLLGNFQVEVGPIATEYTPYERILAPVGVPTSYLLGALQVERTGPLVNTVSQFDGKRFELAMRLAAMQNSVLNFFTVRLDGAVLTQAGDDVAPIETQQGMIGGNHGFMFTRAYSVHDKTESDLGSKWTDGTREYVILQIRETDGALMVGGDWETLADGSVRSLPASPTVALTHVSGATNTSPIAVGGELAQMWPVVQRKRQHVSVDGAELSDGSRAGGSELRIRETYDVLDYASVYDTATQNIGTKYSDMSCEAAFRVESEWVIKAGGKVRGEIHLTELKPTRVAYWDPFQAGPATGTETRFIPGLKSIGALDWPSGVPISSMTTQYPKSTDLIVENVPPSTVIDVAPSFGLAVGVDPWRGDSSSVDRIENAATRLWYISSSKKNYVGSVGTRTPGWGRLSAYGVRTFLTPSEVAQVLETPGDAYATAATVNVLT